MKCQISYKKKLNEYLNKFKNRWKKNLSELYFYRKNKVVIIYVCHLYTTGILRVYPYYIIFIEKKGKLYSLNGYITSGKKKASQRT